MTAGWARFGLVLGGLAGCSAVALDALTAHAFAERLSAHDLATLGTTARYLLVHGLLLLLIAGWQRDGRRSVVLNLATMLAAIGIVLFCGGLTISAVSGLRGFAVAAPFGGSAFLGAWLCVAVYAVTKLE